MQQNKKNLFYFKIYKYSLYLFGFICYILHYTETNLVLFQMMKKGGY
jgi:hypothetical protein